MKYAWQNTNWPNFVYQPTAGQASHSKFTLNAGQLTGKVSALRQADQYDAYLELMVSEAISTSAIEGETLDRASVRSSLKNYLGLTYPPVRVSDPKVLGIAALMMDVRKNIHQPLTKNMLCQWHEMVIPEGGILHQPLRGQYRQSSEPMQVVSGPIGYLQVHYEAPPAAELDAQMGDFLQWYNDTSPKRGQPDPLPSTHRAAIAHLWFECIHPFDDGNGRVGRAIAEHAIGQGLGQPPLLSLSSAVEMDKNTYYEQLNLASRADTNLDITPWIEYFANVVSVAQIDASEKIAFVLGKAAFWDKHSSTPMNERQQKLVRKMLDAGKDGYDTGINAKKYQNMTGCSRATATRDLMDLYDKKVLFNLPGSGRNTRYGILLPPTTLTPVYAQTKDDSDHDAQYKNTVLMDIAKLAGSATLTEQERDELREKVVEYRELFFEPLEANKSLYDALGDRPDILGEQMPSPSTGMNN